MSAVRPGHEHEYEYERRYGYGPQGESEQAYEPAYDPLTDPIPPGEHGSPWFRATSIAAAEEAQPQGWADPQHYPTSDPLSDPLNGPLSGSEGQPHDWYGRETYTPPPAPVPVQAPEPEPEQLRRPVSDPVVVPEAPDLGEVPDTRDVPHDETVALRTSDTRRAVETPPGPGRAERRKAAKGRGGGRRRAPAAGAAAEPAEPAKPLSRVEARRAARAAKDSPAVIASRAIGELFITFGVLMLLFVTYQLWWTNVLAGQQADRAANQIQDDWAKGRKPDAFEPGQGFAIMYIPKLDVVVPIAEGIDKQGVLDRGMVGHYGEGKLKTAMPEDKQGNFAVAGHRNTHGEPFRYINRLEPGDPIVVETQGTYYTYEMASILPQTPPSNVSVIGPVPPQSGFKEPGRYITLTTCTPEFTSTYRMIVWGKMVEERPRSKGKPDALVG
ncbi:class E sortase [Streptomyces sp. NPDC096176]|uniref:class E sortase n=1 Tax=Streptomyces sp. NPDC096176 TaxID=3366079 RepID=UPI0038287B30